MVLSSSKEFITKTETRRLNQQEKHSDLRRAKTRNISKEQTAKAKTTKTVNRQKKRPDHRLAKKRNHDDYHWRKKTELPRDRKKYYSPTAK
mmetsp:Transcript_27020/g.64536  ORF Transcript_27020/g.64536 Transcript_27020/m.64536 type:complete len:91 (+) Transcript_27020:2174-2446(+)